MATTGSTATSSSWRGAVFIPALSKVTKVSKARPGGAGRGSRRWTHSHVGHGRLVSSVSGGLCHSARHGNAQMLLSHLLLLWELVGTRVGRDAQVLHLTLQLLELIRQLLLLRDHAHVDVLLVRRGYLLLLLLKHFNLLGKCQLLHY